MYWPSTRTVTVEREVILNVPKDVNNTSNANNDQDDSEYIWMPPSNNKTVPAKPQWHNFHFLQKHNPVPKLQEPEQRDSSGDICKRDTDNEDLVDDLLNEEEEAESSDNNNMSVTPVQEDGAVIQDDPDIPGLFPAGPLTGALPAPASPPSAPNSSTTVNSTTARTTRHCGKQPAGFYSKFY